MNLEQRVSELEHAHRSLTARNEALYQVCKVMLPIALSSNAQFVHRLLTSCYDATNDHMDKAGWDIHMQEMVRASMDELSNVLMAGTSPHHPN